MGIGSLYLVTICRGLVSCLSSHHLTPLTVKLLPCASGSLPRRTVMGESGM